MQKKEKLAYAGLSLMTLITGLSFIFMKIGLMYTNPYDLLAHRFVIAFLTIIILTLLKIIKLPKIKLKDWISLLGVSLFYPSLFFLFQSLGMEHSSASDAGIIFAFLPILAFISGSIFLKETTSLLQKIGVFLSVSGVIFIFTHRDNIENQNIISVFFLICSVVSMLIYLISGKRIMRSHNSISLTALMVTIGFISFSTISIFRHISNGTISLVFEPFLCSNFIYSVLYLGILSSVLTSFFSNYALIYIPASKISIFSNLNPIIAIIGGIFILDEIFTWTDIIGSALVLLGVLLVLFFKPSIKN